MPPKTIQDLPIELVENILIKVVAMEVKGLKLAKRVWKAKADVVISCLSTVCSQWSSILGSQYVRSLIHRILDDTAQETIRLEILQSAMVPGYVFKVATLRDEIYLLSSSGAAGDVIKVNNRLNLAQVKDVIQLPGFCATDMAACSLSNCVYVLVEGDLSTSVLRITKDGRNHFKVSPWIRDLAVSVKSLSTSTANGHLLTLSVREGLHSASVDIYKANGSLHQKIVSQDLLHIQPGDTVFQKSNGNITIVSSDDQFRVLMMDVDVSGRTILKYNSTIGAQNSVSRADPYGRVLVTDLPNRMELLDSEYNVIDFAGPVARLGEMDYVTYCFEHNEVMGVLSKNNGRSILTRFRFVES